MKGIFRRFPFIICVAATVLLQPNGHPLLFGLSALVAFGNLISSQFLCALDGCRLNAESLSWRSPAYIALLIYRATSATGLAILVYAMADLYSKSG